MKKMMRFLDGREHGARPFAPPFLRHRGIVIAQTALILQYLGARLRLAPDPLRAHQRMLTIMDFAHEAHEVHHPIASSLYYEDQKDEALRRARHFVTERIPKFLSYFESSLDRKFSYVDLGIFQTLEFLFYAFPKAMTKRKSDIPKLLGVRARVAKRPRISAYLASDRRLPMSTDDLFRHYPELDSY